MPHNADETLPGKAFLRRTILARRSGLDADEVKRASLAAARLVSGLERWSLASEVLVYFAFRGEVDVSSLLPALWERGARVLAPRCRPGQAGMLDLACVSCLDELSPGAYGILEPHPDHCPALECFSPDVALIPAVAFDRKGNRLGFGQGYYDRLLAGPAFAKTFLVGLAHDFQMMDQVPRDPWDRPVDAVVTPTGVIWMA